MRYPGLFNFSRWHTPSAAGFIPMMLLLTLAFCSTLLGGCAGKRQTAPPPDKALRAAIEDNVRDETRRAELIALGDRFSQILEELLAANHETSRELDRLLVDYDSDRESFERTFKRYNQKRQALGKQTIALHFEIKALTTPAEWKAIESAMLRMASSQTVVRLQRR